jgi:hypothetical protein
MSDYIPQVRQAHAFREISLDFTTPAEIFRESIANSIDVYARRLWLRTTVEQRRAKETVLIDLSDDGMGMNAESVKAFLNLSDSVKPQAPPVGMSNRKMTGYKAHGTKIYYNSDELQVLSYDGRSAPIYCCVREPRAELTENKVPTAEIQELTVEVLKSRRQEFGISELSESPGTSIRVIGYHQNSKSGLEHDRLCDYILWFTRWASWQHKLSDIAGVASPEVDDLRTCETLPPWFGQGRLRKSTLRPCLSARRLHRH